MNVYTGIGKRSDGKKFMSEAENLCKVGSVASTSSSQAMCGNSDRRIENMKFASSSIPESVALISNGKSCPKFNDEKLLISNKV